MPTISPDNESNSSNVTTAQSTLEDCTEEPSDSGASIVTMDGCQCTVRNTSCCTSLEDAIFRVFSTMRTFEDVPYPFFTMRDLYYSELLDNRGVGALSPPPKGVDFDSPGEQDVVARRCGDLLDRYKMPTRDTQHCEWSYRCDQDQQLFPSFKVWAHLQDSTGNCVPVMGPDQKRFRRVPCQQDESKANWLECSCPGNVMGFRHDP